MRAHAHGPARFGDPAGELTLGPLRGVRPRRRVCRQVGSRGLSQGPGRPGGDLLPHAGHAGPRDGHDGRRRGRHGHGRRGRRRSRIGPSGVLVSVRCLYSGAASPIKAIVDRAEPPPRASARPPASAWPPKEREKKKGVYSTSCSRVVTLPSTDGASTSLNSVSGRVRLLSGVYGRRRER